MGPGLGPFFKSIREYRALIFQILILVQLQIRIQGLFHKVLLTLTTSHHYEVPLGALGIGGLPPTGSRSLGQAGPHVLRLRR